MSDGTADIGVERSTDTGEVVLSLGDREVRLARALVGGGFVLLLAAPAIFARFFVDLLVGSLILSMFAISVDLVWGYTGILTFGHAAFYGAGAYLMATLTTAVGTSGIGYAGLVLAVLLPGGAGLAIAGVLFYRGIDEEYFTILTLAIALIASQVATSWTSVTGGFNGITGVPPLELGIPGVAMTPVTGVSFYYLALFALVCVSLFARRIVTSPFGTTLEAINHNEAKATALGYDTTRHKTLIFGLSAGIAGFAGALYASYSGFVSPPVVGFVLSTEALIWVLIGGRGTVVGAIAGTIFLTLFENMISGALLFSWTLLLGVVLIVIVLAFPGGIVGLLALVGDRLTGGDRT